MRVPTLNQFFRHQLQHRFRACGLDEPATVDYVSDMLTRFAQTRALYAVADAEGRPLEYIVDFLAEYRRAQSAAGGRPDHAREHTIMRHLGEYALFMSGLFRDRLVRRGELPYYLTQGANAYGQCADYEIQPGRRQLYRRLHGNFTHIADTLDGMRHTPPPLLPLAAGAAGVPQRHPLSAFWQT